MTARPTGLSLLKSIASVAVLVPVGPLEAEGFCLLMLRTPQEREIWIDANECLMVSFVSDRRDLRLVLQDPERKTWEIAAPSLDAGPLAPETTYAITIPEPLPGRWTARLQGQKPPPETEVVFTFSNPAQAQLSLPTTVVAVGMPLTASVQLRFPGSRWKEIHLQAEVHPVDPTGPTEVLPRSDSKGDGTYTALLPTSQPGRFQVRIQVAGRTPAGLSQRTATLAYTVAPRSATFTGTVNQWVKPGTPD